MILAKCIGGPRHGETALIRGGVKPGWAMRANEKGVDCLYRLEQQASGYVLRAVKVESVA